MTDLTNAALDLLFEPRGSTTKISNVNLQTSGVDISNRYMDKTLGGGATAATTNIQVGGVDINQKFVKLGDALPAILWGGKATVSINALTECSLTLNSDGTVSQVGTGTAAGNWIDPTGVGKGNDFECRYLNLVGDNLNSGNTTWLALSSNRIFSQLTSVDPLSSTFDIEIRPIGDSGSVESRVIIFTLDGE